MAGRPFKKGNQVACGTIYDLVALGNSLVEWSKRDDAVHLSAWALEQDIYPQRLYEWRDQDPWFAESLKKAKARIALRIRDKVQNGEYNYGIFMRDIPMFDALLHDFERGEKQFDSDLRKGENQQNSENMQQATNKLDAVLDQVKRLQDARSTDKNK
jgi:hypothetical protein